MFSSTVPEVPWRAIVRTQSPTRSYHKNEKGPIALKDVSHTYLWQILKGIAYITTRHLMGDIMLDI
jgi:hypothetical protein